MKNTYVIIIFFSFENAINAINPKIKKTKK